MRLLFLSIVLTFICGVDEKSSSAPQNFSSEQIFSIIEKGFQKGNPNDFKEFLTSKVYLSLDDGKKEFLSSGQIIHVLTNFFNANKVKNFYFETINKDKFQPNAFGKITTSKGRKFNVYISLNNSRNKWAINQIIIN